MRRVGGGGVAERETSVHELTVALIGNPNCGKTTLFNALTGLRQKTANYPGVTVELKKGVSTAGGVDCASTFSCARTSRGTSGK